MFNVDVIQQSQMFLPKKIVHPTSLSTKKTFYSNVYLFLLSYANMYKFSCSNYLSIHKYCFKTYTPRRK